MTTTSSKTTLSSTVTIDQAEMHDAMQALVRSTGTRLGSAGSMQVLMQLAGEEGVHLITSDGMVSQRRTVAADIAEDSSFEDVSVDAPSLTAIIAAFPKGPIELSFDTTTMHVRAEGLDYELAVSEDLRLGKIMWPSRADYDLEYPLAGEVLDMVGLAARCAGRDKQKPYLMAVSITLGNEGAAVARATDGFRIAEVNNIEAGLGFPVDVVLPLEMIAPLGGAFHPQAGMAMFGFGQQLVAVNDSWTSYVMCRRYSEKYPDLVPLMDRPFAKGWSFDTQELKAAMRRVKALAKDKATVMGLTFDGEGQATLALVSKTKTGRATEKLSVDPIPGVSRSESVSLRVNFHAMAEVFDLLGDQQRIYFQFDEPTRPALMTGPESDVVYLTMLIK